ncbi:MAG TPA: hypothetical protein VMZ92_16100 [Planctomycetota bacterium]|nr:hypothetical protein [Planctomycetota bacterium]
MSAEEPREFKFGMTGHRKVLLVFYLLAGLSNAVAGVLHLVLGQAWGMIWLLAACIWGLGTFLLVHATRMPYVRIAADEFVFFRGPMRAPRFIRWDSVRSMRVDDKKVAMTLDSGEALKIHLSAVVEPERQELLDELRRHVGSHIEGD